MVKINLTDEKPDDSGPTVDLGAAKLVHAHHSKSRPGSFHFTILLERPVMFKRFGGEVTIVCTCPGFTNHRKCWHLEAMMFEVSEEAEIEQHYCVKIDGLAPGPRCTDGDLDQPTEAEVGEGYDPNKVYFGSGTEEYDDDGGVGFDEQHDYGDRG